MLNLRKIAVTGDLGAGKSMVSKTMQDLGCCVVSSDTLCHQLLQSHQKCIEQVKTLLGKDVLVNGQIDKKRVAERVFSHPSLLKGLEEILHPLVLRLLESLYKAAALSGTVKFFVVEVPLLFEAKWEGFFDTIIVVTADRSLCVQRMLAKGLSEHEYASREKRLIPIEKKKEKADFIIVNNGTLHQLQTQVKNIVNMLSKTS